MNNMDPDMKERIKSVPQLNAFVSSVSKIMSSNYPNSFWECKDVFKDLLQSDLIAEVINYDLSRLSKDSRYTINKSSSRGYCLVETEQFYLGLVKIDQKNVVDENRVVGFEDLTTARPAKKKKLLSCFTSDQMIGVHSGSIDVETYQQEDPYPIDVLDKSKVLTNLKRFRLQSSEVGYFKAYHDVAKMVEPRETGSILYFITQILGNLRWEYDPETLKPVQAVATNVESSRFQWAADCLVEMERTESAPSLEKLSSHPDHFVRWSAISSLIQFDYEKGVSMLEQASQNDKHPHIRTAAKESLDMLRS